MLEDEKRYEQALDYREQIVQMLRSGGASEDSLVGCMSDLICKYNQFAVDLMASGKLRSGIKILQRIEKLVQQNSSMMKRLCGVLNLTYNNLACGYKKIGWLPQALRCLDQAVTASNNCDSTENLAMTFLNSSAILGELGEHKAALGRAKCASTQCQADLLRIERLSANKDPLEVQRARNDSQAMLAIAYYNIGVQEEALGQNSNNIGTWYDRAAKAIMAHPCPDAGLRETILAARQRTRSPGKKLHIKIVRADTMSRKVFSLVQHEPDGLRPQSARSKPGGGSRGKRLVSRKAAPHRKGRSDCFFATKAPPAAGLCLRLTFMSPQAAGGTKRPLMQRCATSMGTRPGTAKVRTAAVRTGAASPRAADSFVATAYRSEDAPLIQINSEPVRAGGGDSAGDGSDTEIAALRRLGFLEWKEEGKAAPARPLQHQQPKFHRRACTQTPIVVATTKDSREEEENPSEEGTARTVPRDRLSVELAAGSVMEPRTGKKPEVNLIRADWRPKSRCSAEKVTVRRDIRITINEQIRKKIEKSNHNKKALIVVLASNAHVRSSTAETSPTKQKSCANSAKREKEPSSPSRISTMVSREDSAKIIQKVYKGHRARTDFKILKKREQDWHTLHQGEYKPRGSVLIRHNPSKNVLEVKLTDGGTLVFSMLQTVSHLKQDPTSIKHLWEELPKSGEIAADCAELFRQIIAAETQGPAILLNSKALTNRVESEEVDIKPLANRIPEEDGKGVASPTVEPIGDETPEPLGFAEHVARQPAAGELESIPELSSPGEVSRTIPEAELTPLGSQKDYAVDKRQEEDEA